jgi:uncharacterized protein (UPF0335 family)
VLPDDEQGRISPRVRPGFDPKILRRVISIRKQDKAKRDEAEVILERYLSALGMI